MLSKTPLHQLVDRTRLEPWREALLDAADYIEGHGHCKGHAVDEYGSTCLVGALEMSREREYMDVRQAITRMMTHLSKMVDRELIEWNDAPERTPAEVMGAMRECALKGF